MRYSIPFGLNVENQGGEGLQKGKVVRAVCTKAGPGGEKVGDVLRYCTEYKMQLAGSGSENSILTTVTRTLTRTRTLTLTLTLTLTTDTDTDH